ncbi:hypothetical protein Gotri_014422 [Gossypium trilobum]|uniref:Uncharacterized protein n=2 Tax=Gossypium TaxID=3633 RepID=A0A7J9DWN4_9ROSI|nr:hypothetical protein [Gossypium klotzschianum]MBA0765173.1 hypothetical protein [Gossypium trilobum]
MELDFECTDLSIWKEALSSYKSRIQSLNKPNLISLDEFYTHDLPSLLRQRNPNPFITTAELSRLMQWKLTRGKLRPRLLNFVSSLDDSSVQSVSQKAFLSLPDISKAISQLTVLKGVGPATASAVLAAYAPETAPFMSDEAMVAALGSSKDYSLKQYLLFVEKLQSKSKVGEELSSMGDSFRPSDVERALWSSAVGVKLQSSQTAPDNKIKGSNKRKRKH